MIVVPQGYEYIVDSLGNYHIQALVPYSAYNYRVEVLFPVIPMGNIEPMAKPKVSLDDFNTWVQSAEYLVNSENDRLYPLLNLLLELGREIVDIEILGNETMFKRAVSYYVGHYLELHIKALKDEENKMSLNPEQKTENEESDRKYEISMLDNTFGTFKKTLYGQMYYAIYGRNARFSMTGVF